MEIKKGKHSYVLLTDILALKFFRRNLERNFEKEVYFLEKLKEKKYVPKILFYSKEELLIIMERIRGISLEEVLEKGKLDRYKIKAILEICFELDRLRIKKKEMNHPGKHIIFSDGRVVFLDWERATITKKPNNLTEFIAYLYKIKEKIDLELPDKNLLREILKEYKKSYSGSIFYKILQILNLGDG